MIRASNEQLRNLERAFLDDYNLKKTGHAHTIFSPSLINKYIGNTFPFVVDSLVDYDEATNTTSKEEMLDRVKLNLSILTFSINSATSIIQEPIQFDNF